MSEYMFPAYSTFKKYDPIYNFYATLGNTTKLPIEGIWTDVYTLDKGTVLKRNTLHILALHSPLYYTHKHCQRLGCGVYFSYKDGSYLFFPDFILQGEESYDNIVSYRPLVRFYQGLIDYIKPKLTFSINMDTPSVCTFMVTPTDKLSSPHIIPSDEDSIFSEPPIPINTYIKPPLPPPKWGSNHWT